MPDTRRESKAQPARTSLGAPTRTSLTPVGWSINGELDLREWSAQGRQLGALGRSVGWWIGDWLRYGNQRFGERYARAARITGYDVQTLMNMVYVASRFEISRRRETLSFSHHAEVAALGPSDQERLLERAATERMSVRCLREEIRRERRLAAPDEAPALEAETEPSKARERHVCPKCGCTFAHGRPLAGTPTRA